MASLLAILYGFGSIVLIILLIYVIVNRIEEKKGEDFENRDN